MYAQGDINEKNVICELNENDRIIMYSILCITIFLCSITIFSRSLSIYDTYFCYITILIEAILVISIHINNRLLIDITHYGIALILIFSIFVEDLYVLCCAIVGLLFVQIQWKILDKCILYTKEQSDIISKYKLDYVTHIGALIITIILSFKIGKQTNIKEIIKDNPIIIGDLDTSE
jgi:hypothetical protein